MRRFTGDYNADGKEKRREAREAAGYRCLRCRHPFENGKHGRGEWSPCDANCTHQGPIRQKLKNGWIEIVSNATAGELVKDGDCIDAQWRILTVHHLDGDKSNDAWWNRLSLCQRCHLQIQGKVDPETPWFLEHSDWLKPYVAGFYAKKYEGRDITREEALSRLDELLSYERRA